MKKTCRIYNNKSINSLKNIKSSYKQEKDIYSRIKMDKRYQYSSFYTHFQIYIYVNGKYKKCLTSLVIKNANVEAIVTQKIFYLSTWQK